MSGNHTFCASSIACYQPKDFLLHNQWHDTAAAQRRHDASRRIRHAWGLWPEYQAPWLESPSGRIPDRQYRAIAPAPPKEDQASTPKRPEIDTNPSSLATQGLDFWSLLLFPWSSHTILIGAPPFFSTTAIPLNYRHSVQLPPFTDNALGNHLDVPSPDLVSDTQEPRQVWWPSPSLDSIFVLAFRCFNPRVRRSNVAVTAFSLSGSTSYPTHGLTHPLLYHNPFSTPKPMRLFTFIPGISNKDRCQSSIDLVVRAMDMEQQEPDADTTRVFLHTVLETFLTSTSNRGLYPASSYEYSLSLLQ
ncbi:hypothetical protein BDV96DRAFT_648209 [Lophiotrema nucula]|uniref:Uncharacterized protein n=1 Tax=Lophiotrema nucula TaxID=690887 RepID=A0A6A5Z2D8_9PLEO|nr:hypothetical protein BDV96DRAFT_648209 [Lophiotrema nucula]